MVSKEADAYLETGENQLRDAELAFREESYALCAFLSASSAENATSALIITFDAKPSKKHRNSLVLHRLTRTVPPETRSTLGKIIEWLKALEPHVTKARYPILKGLELLPPNKFYTNAMAEKALSLARKVVESIKRIINRTRPQGVR